MRMRIESTLLLIILMSLFVFPFSSFAAQSVPQAVIKAAESVVRITCEDDEYYYTGSGFVIACDDDGTYVATNQHVIEGDIYNLEVWTDEYDNVLAEIVVQDENRDIAILKLSKNYELPVLCIEGREAERGDDVYAIGFPAAADDLSDTMAYGSDETTITGGNINAKRALTLTDAAPHAVELLQIDAAINSGNSGGPLVDRKGHVLGINTLGALESQGINGAIKISELASVTKKAGVTLRYTRDYTLVYISAAAIVIFVLALVIIRKNKRSKLENKAITWTNLLDYVLLKHSVEPYSAVSLLMDVARQLRDMHQNGELSLKLCPESIEITSGQSRIKPDAVSFMASGFTAPEVYRGRNAGAASDIYSFFAVLLYACTGAIPENALDRLDWEFDSIVPDFLKQRDADFASVLEKGLALNAEVRYQSMQEVISALLPFAAMVQLSPLVPEHNESAVITEKPTKEKRAKRHLWYRIPKWIRICTAIVLIIALYFCFGITMWINCVNRINDEQFIKAQKCYNLGIPFTLINAKRLNMPYLPEYLTAGYAYESGNYQLAAELFAPLSGCLNATSLRKSSILICAEDVLDDEGIKEALNFIDASMISDASSLKKELRYVYATKLIKKGDYQTAINVLKAIPEHTGSEDLINEAYYKLAYELFEDEKYLDSCQIYEIIQGYLDSDDCLDEMQDVLYDWALKQYERNHNLYELKQSFRYLADQKYKDAKEYLILVYGWQGDLGLDYINETEKDLINLIGFADTENVIYSQHKYMQAYLEGYWETSDGYYYLDMDNSSCSVNFPKHPSGEYYFIVDGVYKIGSDEDTATDYLDFAIIDKNTLYVYNCRNGDEYWMYRQ